MKKFISLILAIVMVATMVPGMALAADESTPIEYNIATNALTEAAQGATYANNTLGLVSWLAKGSATEATLDVPSKTAAYQLTNRIGSMKDNGPTLYEKGFASQFIVDAWSDVGGVPTFSNDAKYANYTLGNIVYGIRIKASAGKYTLSLKNNFAIGDVASTFKSNGAFTKGAITKVYFGKAETDATSAAEAYSSAKTVVNVDNYVGWYNSMDLSQTTSYEKVLMIPADGEYFVTFVADADSLTKNSDCYFRNTGYAFQQFYISGITLTPVIEEVTESEEERAMKDAIAEEVTEEGLSDNSYVNVITASVDNGDSSFVQSVDKIEATRGEMVTVEADVIEGYNFLYWRNGLGRDAKVITNNTQCTVKAVPGTWLTAVYKATDSEKVSVLFYNADGDIIKNELVDRETAITFPNEPEAPAGCGEFIGWALNVKENIVTSANAISNSMVFVAQYADLTEKNIIVKVPSGATGGGSYAYGDKVTVTATERNDESNVFVYWKKGDEIVSFDTKYTFNAFENCELTAIYAEQKPITEALRKIIIKGSVAEFIGLDTAVEKGVVFRDIDETSVTLGNATHKIAMLTDGNHLAFDNDLVGDGATNYIGYAILANGNVIYDK